VTGAAQGIGRATALALGSSGCALAVCDRLGDELDEVVQEIKDIAAHSQPASAQPLPVLSAELDVRDNEAVVEFVARIQQEWGGLDILVNNAGGGFHAMLEDVSAGGTQALIAENFTQVLDVSRACIPLLAAVPREPGSAGASIVNITSVEAHRAGPGFGIYSAMKSGVQNLTKTLALELAQRRIRVNSVAPDMIPTPGDAGLADAAGAMTGSDEWSMTPWPDEGSPEDVAAAVVFLTSEGARFITGTTVHVDGGTLAASGWKRRNTDGVWVL